MNKYKSLSSCTQLYSLPKTLKFELKPIGKTLDNMQAHLAWDENLQTFLKDQDIENTYQALKPHINMIHEQFITECLESEESKSIHFSGYLEEYRNKKERGEKALTSIEKQLRIKIGELYGFIAQQWKEKKYPQYAWKKGTGAAKSFEILSSQDLLKLIRDSQDANNETKKAAKKILDDKFFTYFSGFNQNRENYYSTKEEKATAVATRIVHVNLPKFCDNVIAFESNSNEYRAAYDFLKKNNVSLDRNGKHLLPVDLSIFDIGHFQKCLSQTQIEIYNEAIGQLNQLINLYNQARQHEKGFKKLAQFKTLYKQIGCGRKKNLFFALSHSKKGEAEEAREKGEEAYSVQEMLLLAKNAGEHYFKKKKQDSTTIETIPQFSAYILNNSNSDGLYWSKAAINTISNKYLATWHSIKDQLREYKDVASYDPKREDPIRINDAVRLKTLFSILDSTQNWQDEDVFFRKSLTQEETDLDKNEKNKRRKDIIKQAASPSKALMSLILYDLEDHTEEFLTRADEIIKLDKYESDLSKQRIKAWIDHAIAAQQMLKYFSVKESKIKNGSLDPEISNALKVLLFEGEIQNDKESVAVDWFNWYNALRNFLTKKPQDDLKKNKLKLNFENSTLASGWDINKESSNSCIILQNPQGKQYLAIIARAEKRSRKIFDKTANNPLYKFNNEEAWQKMEYKQIAAPTGIGGFVRKCFNTAQQYGWKCPKNCLNKEGKIIIKNDEAKANLEAIIDCYKDFFNKYEKDGYKYRNFCFNFQKSNRYKTLNEFFDDVERQGYKLNFTSISKSVIEQWVEDGKIYLFEIKNQDANDGKKEGHKNNLHTIYWKALFENIENKPKLNGGAELFYRKALPKDKQVLINDRHNKEIIKNFRFSKEKFLFHCPIRLNYQAKDYSKPEYALKEVNSFINDKMLKENVHFLGIDRGEKHLIYYSLINSKGEIIHQDTLNTIGTHNYHEKLDRLEKNRQEARKNWQTIGTIKELKEGYISQVVRKIADIALEHNAFIILEDLNTGFKRGRQRIEKSIYQKLELALAKKLNFLVDKSAKNGEVGSVINALQLTPPVNNYKDIEKKKQLGIMLYTRANYTSITDPVTGWRKTIYLQKGSEKYTKDQILQTFTEIAFDGKDYYFEYVDKKTQKRWRLYSSKDGGSLERFRGKRGDKNEWNPEPIDILQIFNQVFANYDKKKSLYKQMQNDVPLAKTKERPDLTAWESLRFAIDVMQQIRNTGKSTKDNDFLLSPVRDGNGNHFDSRTAVKNLPNCGDANGAYNIARKGIIMHEHMRRKYTNLCIYDDEWDAWLCGTDQWEKWIKENEKKLK